MTTAWIYFANAITTDKVLGDRIGCALDPDPNATEAFTTPLRLIGSQETTAWLTTVPLTEFGRTAMLEFQSDGPYPTLLSIGVAAEDIQPGRAAITIELGPRDEFEGRALAFIAEHGYEVIPRG